MTTANATPFKTHPALYFADADAPRPGHILVIGDRLSDRDASWRAFELSGDSFSTYRFSVGPGPIKSLALEIEITGRKEQYRDGCYYLRARLTLPGDGEPDTVLMGWVQV